MVLFGTAEAVPFPVVVDRPVSGGAGREATGAEARLYCGALRGAESAALPRHCQGRCGAA